MFFSQIRQDEAANYLLNKDGGYFLDIGAGTNSKLTGDHPDTTVIHYFWKTEAVDGHLYRLRAVLLTPASYFAIAIWCRRI